MKLRNYQIEVLRAVHSAFSEGKQGAILQMATGAGKTATAGYVVQKYNDTGRTVLWLVHRNELLFQACMTFSKMGIKHQLIASKSTVSKVKVEQFREFGKVFLDETSTVYVASAQTMIRRLDKLNIKPDLIIPDECHLSLNNTFSTIIKHYPTAKLLGLTATPTREDKKSFSRDQGGLYDEIVCGPQPYELIESGHLCDYDLFIPPVKFEAKKLRTKGHDYHPDDLEAEFITSSFLDVVAHYRKLSHNKPAIGFCPSVRIAEEFTRQFIEAGYNAVTLTGETDATVRYNTLKALAVGDVHVVMSVDILIEGTDIPLATTALMLRKTKSLRIYLQSVGRVLRPHPEKEKAIILDFVGLVKEHGYPDDHREWSLNGKVQRRSKPRPVDDDEVVRIQTCPECYKAHEPADCCPFCGHKYTKAQIEKIEIVAGDLIKIERQRKIERAKIEEKQKQTRRLEERQCKTYQDWYNLGVERNYEFPQKWAYKKHQLQLKRRIN